MEPSFDAWSLFFLVAASQGAFLSVLLFNRKSSTNHLLGALILSFSICMGYYVVFWTGYFRVIPWQIGALQGLTFSFGPLAYAYLLSNRKQTRFSWYHLIPMIIYMTYFVIDPPPRQLAGYIMGIGQLLHLFVYAFLMIQYLRQQQPISPVEVKRHQWHKKVAIAFFGYCLSFLLYDLLAWTGLIKPEYDYMISLAATIFIYFIGYYGFQRQEVLKMNEDARYDKSTLNESASQAILKQLKILMETHKPYLDASLKLQDVATKLGIQSHHISQVVNELEEKNFSDFINEYRVSAAIKLLKTTDHKIIHVAYDSGFNNKASFNNAFKKVTGMPPGEYREAARSIA